jgi:hypothetical protein
MNLEPQELEEIFSLVCSQIEITDKKINEALKAHDAKEFNAGIEYRTTLYNIKAKVSLAHLALA